MNQTRVRLTIYPPPDTDDPPDRPDPRALVLFAVVETLQRLLVAREGHPSRHRG